MSWLDKKLEEIDKREANGTISPAAANIRRNEAIRKAPPNGSGK